MNDDKPDLDTAYGLKTPRDSKRLYAEWAGDYDASFAVREDYQLPI
ncbi:MAG: methyltransferase, partial [Robiginitomaculum sp.]